MKIFHSTGLCTVGREARDCNQNAAQFLGTIPPPGARQNLPATEKRVLLGSFSLQPLKQSPRSSAREYNVHRIPAATLPQGAGNGDQNPGCATRARSGRCYPICGFVESLSCHPYSGFLAFRALGQVGAPTPCTILDATHPLRFLGTVWGERVRVSLASATLHPQPCCTASLQVSQIAKLLDPPRVEVRQTHSLISCLAS